MKNISILLLLTGLSGCFIRSREKSDLEGKILPAFNLLLTDSLTVLNTGNIPTGKPIVLFYFSPDCPYCRAEITEITDNVKKLKDIQFYIFTPVSFRGLKQFYERYQLKNYSNLTVGQDYSFYFSRYFKPRGIPCLAIYDTSKLLKQIIIGKTTPSDIKNIAFE